MQVDPRAFYYPNVAYFSGTSKEHAREEFVREHVLCHIIAGELRFTEAEKDTIGKAGETYLFRRNLLLKCEKRPLPEGPFKIVYFVLENEFLQQYALKHGIKRTGIHTDHKPVLFLDPKPALKGLIQSIYSYVEAGKFFSKDMIQHKLVEAILALQEQDEQLEDWLFDFQQQGKIDLYDFMERNYMFNVPMTKFAELTGRSLSTFQRDFHRIFGMNATRWLLKRRVQAAYEALTSGNKMPVDIYLDLGFEDLAHFSRSFKNEFGFSPSQLTVKARKAG